jgi:hypothetical protein
VTNTFKRFRVILLVLIVFVICLVVIFLFRRSSVVFAEYKCVSGVEEFKSKAAQAEVSHIRCLGPGDGCFGNYLLANHYLRPNGSVLSATCEGFFGPFVDVKVDNNGKILSLNSVKN